MRWSWLGSVPYEVMRERQRARADDVAAGAAPPVLWLLEHPDVVTVGRGGDWDEARRSGLPAAETERGGGLTWHGPGQLVGYPVLRLDDHDVHGHLRRLEDTLIRFLHRLGLPAGRRSGLTGVWTGEKKIASIGIAVRRWTAFHGFALNVAPDLRAFRNFRPCGLDPDVMTSLAELGMRMRPEEAAPGVAAAFGEAFGMEMAEEPAVAEAAR